MPFRWLAVMITVSALVFSSGCSLVAKEWMEASQKQIEEQQKQDEKKKEAAKEKSSEEDDEPQSPTNAEGADSSADGGDRLVEGKELQVSNITIMADDRDWQKADYESEDSDHEYTEFTPGGRSADASTELLGVHFFKGLHQQATVAETASVMRRGMEEESEGTVGWKVLSQSQEDVLVELSIDDADEGNLQGYTRFLSTDEGIYMILYLTANMMGDSDKEKWMHLLKQANNTGLTL